MNVYIIWLALLLNFMRIQEIFNITEGRDINFGVDFLLLIFDFYLKKFGLA